MDSFKNEKRFFDGFTLVKPLFLAYLKKCNLQVIFCLNSKEGGGFLRKKSALIG